MGNLARTLARGRGRARGRGLAAGSGGGGSVVLPTIAALSTFWEAETTAFDTAVGGLSAGEKYALDRCIKHLKSDGTWTAIVASGNSRAIARFATKAKALVNIYNPAANPTEVGTITYTQAAGYSTSGPSNYIDSGVGHSSLPQSGLSFGGICLTANGVAGSYSMGDADASSTGRNLLLEKTATGTIAGAVMCATVTTIGAASDFNLPGPVQMSRDTSSGSFLYTNYTQQRASQATASVAGVAATPFKWLWATGAAASANNWGAFWLHPVNLTAAQRVTVAAAYQNLSDALGYGTPEIQPAGYGDAAVTVDGLYYGNMIEAAYEHKRQFPSQTVAILFDWMLESREQIGGQQQCGLTWPDINTTVTFPASGLFYEITRQAVLAFSGTPGNSQAGLSCAVQGLQRQANRMLDPSRSSGTLPGLDIKCYLGDGIRSITQDKVGLTGVLTTNGGRVFNFKRLGEVSDDGDTMYHLGIPYTQGQEAQGTGKESLNGWIPTQKGKPKDAAGNAYNVDPTGLTLDLIAYPSGNVNGQAYQGYQAINIRQAAVNATSNKARKAPWGGGAIQATPRNYNVTRTEPLRRCLAAMNTAVATQTKDDVLSFNTGTTDGTIQGPYGNVIDLNNGPLYSSDLSNSGNAYAACGQSIAARKVVAGDICDFFNTMVYWWAYSGDAAISAAIVTSLTTNFGPDASAFLDYHSIFPMHVSKGIYRRVPPYRLNGGVGGAIIDANDGTAADGATPRISNKTFSSCQYQAFDHHSEFYAVDHLDGFLSRYGSYSDTSQGNTNKRTPIPGEVTCAPEATCPIWMTATCISATDTMHAAYRMVPQMSLTCQMIGATIGQSIADGVSVQNTLANKYSTVRALILANPDSVAALLTQTT